MTRVAGDDDAFSLSVLPVGAYEIRDALARFADGEPVHAVRPCAELTAKSRGPEGQFLIETVADLFFIFAKAGQLLLQRIRIRQLLQPVLVTVLIAYLIGHGKAPFCTSPAYIVHVF